MKGKAGALTKRWSNVTDSDKPIEAESIVGMVGYGVEELVGGRD